jgi:hypothetical protein
MKNELNTHRGVAPAASNILNCTPELLITLCACIVLLRTLRVDKNESERENKIA